MIRKPCCSRFSLHKFVHLKFFWTQFKNVHLRGPCSLRSCISRPYCNLVDMKNVKEEVKNICSFWVETLCHRKTLRRTFVSRGKNGCFFDRREKNNFFRGKQMFFSEFFWPRHNVFSLKDTFSSYFILWPPISLYFLMGSVSYCPHEFC